MEFDYFIPYNTDYGKIGFLMAFNWQTHTLHYFVGACHGLNSTIDMNQVYNGGVELPPEAGMVIFFGEWDDAS